MRKSACFPAATKGAVEWMPPERRGLAVSLANGGSAFGALTWIPFFALGVTNIAAGRVSDLLVTRGWPRRRARLTLMLGAALLTMNGARHKPRSLVRLR